MANETKHLRRAFLEATTRLGVAPDETLFVGDDPLRDIEGAHRAGLQTCWVAHGRRYPAGRTPPDLVVQAAHELREILRS